MSHYSPSQFRKYQDCPQQYAYRYIKKLHEKTKESLVIGRAVDEAINSIHIHTMNPSLPANPAQYLFQAIESERYTAGDEMTTEQWDVVDEMANRFIEHDVFTEYQNMIDYKVRAVQHDMVLRIHGLDRKIIGIADCIAERDTFNSSEHYEKALILDVKTSARSMSMPSYGYKFQMSVYALAWMCMQGTDVIPQCEVRVLIKKKSPEWQVINVPILENDLAHVLEVARTHDRSVKAHYYPINRDSKFCSKKNCSFFKRCHEEHGGRLSDVLAQCIRG